MEVLQGLSPAGVAAAAIEPLVAKAVSAFVSHPVALSPPPKTARDDADRGFWERESLYHTTADGCDPPDWGIRCRLVYKRDRGCCVRCGRVLDSSEGHTHHRRLRSQGGSHALDNLALVCPDCHCLMPDHEHMKAIRPYYVSKTGKLHTSSCGYGGRKVWGTAPRLVSQGYAPCRSCNVFAFHDRALRDWQPKLAAYLKSELLKLLENLASKDQASSQITVSR